MFVELHVLQNFAPSNLNRDDTGSPKDCEFGGHRRARISSQCLKRAIRKESGFADFLGEKGGVRTRRLILEVAERLSGARPPSPEYMKIVSEVFKDGGLDRGKAGRGDNEAENDNTSLILFMEKKAIDALVSVFKSHWPELTSGKKDVRAVAVSELGELLVNGVRAPDIALFGRMVEIDASKPFGKLNLGIDAACQVAHAISTNKVSNEFDYYTAVDDLQPDAETGAGMIGTVEFNSACFYRYTNIDLNQLIENLDSDEGLARSTVEAFIRASVSAIPSGKQNSMAAQNPPSFIMGVVRERGLWSLANAFLNPVRADATGDLMRKSIEHLDNYWGGLTRIYGTKGIAGNWFVGLDTEHLKNLGTSLPNFDALVQAVMERIGFARQARTS